MSAGKLFTLSVNVAFLDESHAAGVVGEGESLPKEEYGEVLVFIIICIDWDHMVVYHLAPCFHQQRSLFLNFDPRISKFSIKGWRKFENAFYERVTQTFSDRTPHHAALQTHQWCSSISNHVQQKIKASCYHYWGRWGREVVWNLHQWEQANKGAPHCVHSQCPHCFHRPCV